MSRLMLKKFERDVIASFCDRPTVLNEIHFHRQKQNGHKNNIEVYN